MRLPIPLLLYVTSAGLFAFAGWTVYEMLPLWKDSVRTEATGLGQREAEKLLTSGKGQGGTSIAWRYGQGAWWQAFRDANLIGKLPPPPPEANSEAEKPPPVVEKPVRPLEDLFELVAIVFDSQTGAGGNSHVIIRYKPEANVQPPEWYVREKPDAPAASAPAAARDVVATRPPGARPVAPPAPLPGQKPPINGARPSSPMPVSNVGREMLQKLWIDDGGDPRRSGHLWEPYPEIRLVRVAPDARSAFFVRVPPPPKAGESAIEPKEEEMLKTTLGLSQDVLLALRRLDGRDDKAVRTAPATPAAQPKWVDVEETTMVNRTVNIGRKDERVFRENPDQIFSQINLDTYVSKSGSLSGLQVRNVDPQLAARFGVQQGEVLVELNGRPVQTKAQAMQVGKADYERGVRTFQTKWWSNGQIVERTYQAPDR